MATPPTRASISGTPSRATANTGFGALWDYVTGLLGSTGNAAEAQTALGGTTIGKTLFTAADAATVRQAAGVPNSGPLSGRRNLVINGNFAINQRGYVSGAAVGAANTYTLDRWRVVTSGQNATFVAAGNGYTVTAPAGGLEQVIEGASIAGGTYVINWAGTATCTVGGTARAKGGSFTLTANTNVTIRFSSGTVSEVQVEPGSVVTAFESSRAFGLELLLCRRYYEVLNTGCTGVSSAAGDFATWMNWQVEKRASPTVTRTQLSASNVTSTSVDNPSASGARFVAAVTASGAFQATASVVASAEL